MNNINLSKKHKFPLGAVFTILAGAAVVMNLMLYFIQRILFSVFYFQQYSFSGLLSSGIYSVLFITEYCIMLIALLALAVFLILKQRKKLLVALPIAMTVTYFIAIFSYILDFINGYNFTIRAFLNIFSYVLIGTSCLLLAVIIFLNSGEQKNKLPFLAWIAPVPALLGHFILFVISAVKFPSDLYFVINHIRPSDLFLYSISTVIGSFRSLFFYPIFGILFALTIFFAARWIINPYKKSAQIEEDGSKQVTE